jgi:hypothetical protein
LKNPRCIKLLLEIDIDFLYQNSVFKVDLISDINDNRNFLLFDLKSKLFKLFDQYQISIIDNKTSHLEFRASNYDYSELRKFIGLIVNEYGVDENSQTSSDWNSLKYMSWWFKNENHEPTNDDF